MTASMMFARARIRKRVLLVVGTSGGVPGVGVGSGSGGGGGSYQSDPSRPYMVDGSGGGARAVVCVAVVVAAVVVAAVVVAAVVVAAVVVVAVVVVELVPDVEGPPGPGADVVLPEVGAGAGGGGVVVVAVEVVDAALGSVDV